MEPHHCPHCEKVFGSKAACAVHCHKIHGNWNKFKAKIETDFCAACLQHFECPTRVYNHLYKSARCSRVYDDFPVLASWVCDKVWDGELLKHRALIKRGYKHHKAAMPAIRCQGPLLKAAYEG
eukprot:3812914-Karenia_brevis.AAC.1